MGDDENNTKYKARKNNTTGADNRNQEQESAQKAAHVGGKAAANYFGGPVGGKLYDAASKTKLGQALERGAGKAINKNPSMRRASQAANKYGALDAANKGMDMMGGQTPSASDSSKPKDPSMQKDGIKREGLEEKNTSSNPSKKRNLLSGLGQGNPSVSSIDDNNIGSTAISNFFKKHWKKLLPIAGYLAGFFLILILVMGMFNVIISPAQAVLNFFLG